MTPTGATQGSTFFDRLDDEFPVALIPGQFNLRGFGIQDLRGLLSCLPGTQISRLISGLRMHGLVKKVQDTYRCYLTGAYNSGADA